jgi:nicotinamide mononucleotide transporter
MNELKQTLNKKTTLFSFFRDYFNDWTLFEKIWVFVFFAVNIYLFFIFQDTWVGLVASLTGMLCVVLTAKARISNYYFGIINVILYAYIAFQSKYYGEFLLNIVYFLPMSFIGIVYWFKHQNKKKIDSVNVKKIKTKEFIFWLVISAIGVLVYGIILGKLGGTLPFIDATSTVLSITGMILTVRIAKEQWILWIIVDIVEVVMWVYIFITTGANISMVIMWTAYLTNACYGYYNWRKMENKLIEDNKNGKK